MRAPRACLYNLKVEAIHGERFATREAMRRTIFEYTGVAHNRQRLHSASGSLSPADYEAPSLF